MDGKKDKEKETYIEENLGKSGFLKEKDQDSARVYVQLENPEEGVATGILFGNKKDTDEENLSPSLQVVKESVINYEMPYIYKEFDITLESWCKQGVLMINSALTCEVNKVGSHTEAWRPFISKLIYNISKSDNGYVFVLFGRQAQSFRPYIAGAQYIIEVEHPAYFARMNKKMSSDIWNIINQYLKKHYNEQIEFYKDARD